MPSFNYDMVTWFNWISTMLDSWSTSFLITWPASRSFNKFPITIAFSFLFFFFFGQAARPVSSLSNLSRISSCALIHGPSKRDSSLPLSRRRDRSWSKSSKMTSKPCTNGSGSALWRLHCPLAAALRDRTGFVKFKVYVTNRLLTVPIWTNT